MTQLKIEAGKYCTTDREGQRVTKTYPEVMLDGVTVVVSEGREVLATSANGQRTEYVRDADHTVTVQGTVDGTQAKALREALGSSILTVRGTDLEELGISLISVQEYDVPEAVDTDDTQAFSIVALSFRPATFYISKASNE